MAGPNQIINKDLDNESCPSIGDEFEPSNEYLNKNNTTFKMIKSKKNEPKTLLTRKNNIRSLTPSPYII